MCDWNRLRSRDRRRAQTSWQTIIKLKKEMICMLEVRRWHGIQADGDILWVTYANKQSRMAERMIHLLNHVID